MKSLKIHHILLVIGIMLISNITKASTVNNSLLPIDNLIVRNDLINEIGRQLKSSSSSMYIAGEAGVGKTQLVRKYLDLNKNDYQVIWWINFKNDITFQVKELKRELQDQICESKCNIPVDEDNVFKGVKNFIRKKNLKALIIIDNLVNANDAAYLKGKLEGEKNLKTIFISRRESNRKTDITVLGFSDKETHEYLKKSLLPERIKQDQIVKSIIKDAKGIPLALERLVYLFNTMTNLEIEGYSKIKHKSQIGDLLDTDERLVLEDPGYDRNLYYIYNQNFVKIKSENKDAYTLLKYISYLSESIGEETLSNIWEAFKGDNNQAQYYKTVNYLTKSFTLKGYKRSDNQENMLVYEIHPLLKEILYSEVNKEEGDIKNIKFLSDVFINLLPRDFTKVSEYTAKNQSAFINFERLIEVSGKSKVDSSNILLLKIKLLRIYCDNFLYKRAMELIKEIYKDISKFKRQKDKTYIEHLAMFYVLEGRLWNYKYANYEKGLSSLREAEKISKEVGSKIDESITFLILCHIADVLYHSGNIEESKIYIKKINNELSEYLSKNKKLEYFNMLKAKLLFNDGLYQEALEEAEKGLAIKIQRLGSKSTLLLPYVILKSDIFIHMKKYEKAKEYLDQYYKKCFQGEYDVTSLLESRILRLRGLANLKLGDNKNGERDINHAIELIQKDSSILDSDHLIHI